MTTSPVANGFQEKLETNLRFFESQVYVLTAEYAEAWNGIKTLRPVK